MLMNQNPHSSTPESKGKLFNPKRKLFLGSAVVLLAIFATIGLIVVNQVPLEKATLNQAFDEETQLNYLPNCKDLKQVVTNSHDIQGISTLGEEAALKTSKDDTVAFLEEHGLVGVPVFEEQYTSAVNESVLVSLENMISQEKKDFEISESQLSKWNKSWLSFSLNNCDLKKEHLQNIKHLAKADMALSDVIELAAEQEAMGREVKQAFPGYPRVVSIGSINSKVAVWIQRQSSASELVALAPGVYTPYNPNTPNLSSYYNDWTGLFGDCGVIRQFFSPMSYSCGPGIFAGSEEP